MVASRRRANWRRLVETAVAMLLSALLVAALVALYAAPYFGGPPPPEARPGDPGELYLVVDVSRSMAAREPDGRTRLERAVHRATLVARAAIGPERVTVVAAGSPPAVLVRRTDSAEEVAAVLAELEAGPGGADLARAVAWIERTAGKKPRRVVVLTDGAGESGRALLEAAGPGVQVIAVGSPLPNRHLGEVRVERRWGEDTLHAFGRVASPGPERVTVEAGPSRIAVEVPAGEPFHVEIDPGHAKEVRVALEGEDAFPPDDAAVLAVPPPRRVRVDVVTPDGSPSGFLLGALAVQADRIDQAASRRLEIEEWSPDSVRPGDLVLFDRCHPPAPPPAGTSVFLDPAALEAHFGLSATRRRGGPVAVHEEHPLLAALSLESLHVASDRTYPPPPELDPIATAGEDALLLAGADGVRLVYLTFPLAESNLPLLADFPLFVRNLILWADGLAARPPRATPGGPESDLEPAAGVPPTPAIGPLATDGRPPHVPAGAPFLLAGIAFAMVEFAYYVARAGRR